MVFGEIGWVLKGVSTADRVLLHDCTCFFINQDKLDRMLKELSQIVHGLLKTLSKRLKLVNDRMLEP